MVKTELYKHDIDGQPAPRFASDAEIEIAERLRHQLEERYLAPFASPGPAQRCRNESH